jgi:ABC-type uncharacterized transport system substrate-binding protein
MGKIKRMKRFWISILCLPVMLAGTVSSAFACAACAGVGSDIYVRIHVTIQDNGIQQIDVRWDLSEMLSQSLLEQYDVNGDGILDDKEARLLTAFFSEVLHSSDYFTTITVNERKLNTLGFESPRFEWQPAGAGFIYSIPLNAHIKDMLDLTVQVMDPDFNFTFYYRPDSVTWNQPKGYRLSHNARRFPQILTISIQPENGSTVIPSPQASHRAGVSDIQPFSGCCLIGFENTTVIGQESRAARWPAGETGSAG